MFVYEKSFKSKLMSFLLTTIADDFYINILRHHHIEVGKYIVRTVVHPPTASERLKMRKKWVDAVNGLPPKRSHP